jgi:hypothetical protein
MRKRKRKERGRREELPVFVPATQCWNVSFWNRSSPELLFKLIWYT